MIFPKTVPHEQKELWALLEYCAASAEFKESINFFPKTVPHKQKSSGRCWSIAPQARRSKKALSFFKKIAFVEKKIENSLLILLKSCKFVTITENVEDDEGQKHYSLNN